jgi:hypothetical protein
MVRKKHKWGGGGILFMSSSGFISFCCILFFAFLLACFYNCVKNDRKKTLHPPLNGSGDRLNSLTALSTQRLVFMDFF